MEQSQLYRCEITLRPLGSDSEKLYRFLLTEYQTGELLDCLWNATHGQGQQSQLDTSAPSSPDGSNGTAEHGKTQ